MPEGRSNTERQKLAAAARNSMQRFVTGFFALLGMICWTSGPTPAVTITGYMSVLTMSHDGSWGADMQLSLDDALQNAITRCKKMRGLKLGCGGYVISIENGWLLGTRCGTRSILSSGTTRAEAEEDADHREKNMRRDYVPNLPACRRVVSVDPAGAVEAADVALSTR
jgi:hypothetical protein